MKITTISHHKMLKKSIQLSHLKLQKQKRKEDIKLFSNLNKKFIRIKMR